MLVKILFLIALCGGLGSVSRFLLSRLCGGFQAFSLPWATLLVNVVGSILIGAFYALSEKYSLSQGARLLLTTGFCGGFTTFSTFSYENLQLLRQGDYRAFFLYVSLSLFACLVGVAFGHYLFSTPSAR